MATFSISDAFLTSVYSIIRGQSHGLVYADGGGGTAKIRFMSGTPETDFSNLTSATALSGQVLWDASVVINDWDTFSDRLELNHQAHHSATATGTVQWFWYLVYDGYNNIDFQFIGTVGTSGTDLILPSTTITSGKKYKVTGLTLTINQDYTF